MGAGERERLASGFEQFLPILPVNHICALLLRVKGQYSENVASVRNLDKTALFLFSDNYPYVSYT